MSVKANKCVCGSENLRKRWYRGFDGMNYRIECDSCGKVASVWLPKIKTAVLEWNEMNPIPQPTPRPQEDQKARECPFCGSPAMQGKPGLFSCSAHPDNNCAGYYAIGKLSQWNNRPRERRLEEVLGEAEEAIENCKTRIGICMGSCFLPEEVSSALSAINAALEEKR